MMAADIVCSECGCPYSSSLSCCPECGAPNKKLINADIRGYATECPCCGAPANGLRICQWCGSSIPFVGSSFTDGGGAGDQNKTILECELKRLVAERHMFQKMICCINVRGHKLMEIIGSDSSTCLQLHLLGVLGPVRKNFFEYSESHSFDEVANGLFSRYFDFNYIEVARVISEILPLVYEVANEQVFCTYENTPYQTANSDNSMAKSAAFVGGAILGTILDNI